MRRTLAIVERAHRGAVEQQYAHVLWLAHGLHRQSPMNVLLRGLAAVYAVDAAAPPPLVLGGGSWGTPPDYRAALARLLADDARVLVSASSLARLGLDGSPLCPGVVALPDGALAAFIAQHRRIWFL
jgi:hypothetical protein